jgi:hypothetical protein
MSLELQLDEIVDFVKSQIFYSVYDPRTIAEAINAERKKGYKCVSIHYFHPYESYSEDTYNSQGNYNVTITKWRPQSTPNCYVIFEKIL